MKRKHKWRMYGMSTGGKAKGTERIADWQTWNMSGVWWCRCGTLRTGCVGNWTYHRPDNLKKKG